MKQSEHFNNIINLKRQLEEIENSQLNLEHDIGIDMSNLKASKRNLPYMDDNINPVIDRRYQPSVRKPMMVDITADFNNTNNTDQDATVQTLVRELDEIKESNRQKDLKIETLNFRTEKLQTELALKLDFINKITLEVEEKDAILKRLSNQNKHLESVVDQNKTGLLPEHQRLKSQYDISLLEIRSLEKDNDILEARIKELLQHSGVLKNENRELKTTNFKIEQERLKLKQDVESLRMGIVNNENDYVDLSEKYETVQTENERLKNELIILRQKLDVYSTGEFDIVSRKIVSRFAMHENDKGVNIKSSIFVKKVVNSEKLDRDFKDIVDIKDGNVDKQDYNYRIDRSNIKNPVIKAEIEKLNFDGILSMEQDFKRKFKD